MSESRTAFKCEAEKPLKKNKWSLGKKKASPSKSLKQVDQSKPLPVLQDFTR